MSSKMASYMKWHAQGRTTNGLMRHPVDSLSWKRFDSLNPTFALEHHNVRLGLACDGFNAFSNMSIAYSTCLVVLIPYNLPPWMCMKQSFFMLSLLILGPTAPGNDIDIYLQPLIDELQELREHGVLHMMLRVNKIFSCLLLYYGQLVTFLHMQTFQDGVRRDNLLVLLAIKKLVPIN